MEPMDIVGKSKEDVSLPKAYRNQASNISRLIICNQGSVFFQMFFACECKCTNLLTCYLVDKDVIFAQLQYASATMFKIIKEMLPPDVRVARDAQDLLVECCVEFINLVSSESNEVCSREEKRTIAPEHVLQALQDLGFGEYIEEVYAAYEQHKLETMDSPKGGKWNGVEMTEEEALAEQQRMFAEARARMNNGINKPSDTGSTES